MSGEKCAVHTTLLRAPFGSFGPFAPFSQSARRCAAGLLGAQHCAHLAAQRRGPHSHGRRSASRRPLLSGPSQGRRHHRGTYNQGPAIPGHVAIIAVSRSPLLHLSLLSQNNHRSEFPPRFAIIDSHCVLIHSET